MEFFADILKISRVEKLSNGQGTYVLSLALTICTLFRQLINEIFLNLFLKVILPFSFISKIYLDLSDTVQFLWMSVVRFVVVVVVLFRVRRFILSSPSQNSPTKLPKPCLQSSWVRLKLSEPSILSWITVRPPPAVVWSQYTLKAPKPSGSIG